ncbi:hypothetical protein [Marinitenerispora sediminis]|uniref:Uncharacterized protein n=1 Tax=Marinitenerispora sediminis TaxID=1931232 RepID=A0A368T7T9_9ACTN|nr:hypothetical protein [Marinitenerispora sediminis]RCV53024.1 hypothetical protein DEF28_11370 [Marinitenerispora sediminis]RCV56626.1 hypothetical protein DEF23_12260 [Marinitenerispora sediminis]RCV59882.1 hypothetical protein DEF24_08580 [Marinitenerispora sediminis]
MAVPRGRGSGPVVAALFVAAHQDREEFRVRIDLRGALPLSDKLEERGRVVQLLGGAEKVGESLPELLSRLLGQETHPGKDLGGHVGDDRTPDVRVLHEFGQERDRGADHPRALVVSLDITQYQVNVAPASEPQATGAGFPKAGPWWPLAC